MLVKFYEDQKELSDELEQVVLNGGDGYCLDGRDIDFQLPDLLVRECERQMHLGNCYKTVYQVRFSSCEPKNETLDRWMNKWEKFVQRITVQSRKK